MNFISATRAGVRGAAWAGRVNGRLEISLVELHMWLSLDEKCTGDGCVILNS